MQTVVQSTSLKMVLILARHLLPLNLRKVTFSHLSKHKLSANYQFSIRLSTLLTDPHMLKCQRRNLKLRKLRRSKLDMESMKLSTS
jgi:hypothetical protein